MWPYTDEEAEFLSKKKEEKKKEKKRHPFIEFWMAS